MTKYIITDDSDRYCRICEDTTSRDHWLTPDIFIDHTRSVEISDEDYTRQKKFFWFVVILSVLLKIKGLKVYFHQYYFNLCTCPD